MADPSERLIAMAKRKNEPGPTELHELEREDERAIRNELSEVSELEAAEDLEGDDGELTDDDVLEIDQTELAELGLTLDDPHQPEPE